MDNQDRLFLIVTALGRDPGLGSLIRALHGCEVPKALAMVTSSGSLLQRTVAAFQPLVPSRRTYVVVPAQHESRARGQLAPWSAARVVAAPDDTGGAGTVMQILADVLSMSPEADVIVASADSYAADPTAFVNSFAVARDHLGIAPAAVLGAPVARPNGSRPWLLPIRRLHDGLFAFREVEVPGTEEEARRHMAHGAMWNTGSFIARARYLWQLLVRVLPMHADSITQQWRIGSPMFETLARAIAEVARGEAAVDHFEVLMREYESIGLAGLEDAGWSDWASPEEVLYSLPSALERGWLLSRLSSEEPEELSPDSVFRLEPPRQLPVAKRAKA